MTQVELAARMNKDQQNIQRLEKGRINPSIYFLEELSEALEIKVSDFLP